MTNYLIIRRSPNWRSYDLRETVDFLRGLNAVGALNLNLPWPEDLITSFSSMWDEVMAISFKEFRARAREITIDSAMHTDSRLLFSDQWNVNGDYKELESIIKNNDRIIFTDDDDWINPHAFSYMDNEKSPILYWDFIFTGHVESKDYNIPIVGKNILKRPASSHLFTNNYAISGDILKAFGTKKCMEHYSMQEIFDSLKSESKHVTNYLSSANRGLCSSTTIQLNRSLVQVSSDVRMLARRYKNSIDEIVTDHDTDWIRPYLVQVQALLRLSLKD